MFNSNRVETIKKDIQTSTLLSDSEKSDWLSLLELMNDKQLGELEEILSASPPQTSKTAQSQQPQQPTTPAPVKAPPVQAMPPLSHIANVPSGVDMNRSQITNPIRPQAPSPTPSPAPVSAPTPVPTPISARPTPSPTLSNMPPRSTPQKPQPSTPANNPVSPAPTSSAPAPAPESEPAPAPQQSQSVFAIRQLEDLQQISVDTIRNFSFQSIFNVIRSAIQENGYFAILQLVESSPLFSSYLSSGNKRLGGTSSATEPELTQAEFEFMTDLLRNMRFNRW